MPGEQGGRERGGASSAVGARVGGGRGTARWQLWCLPQQLAPRGLGIGTMSAGIRLCDSTPEGAAFE